MGKISDALEKMQIKEEKKLPEKQAGVSQKEPATVVKPSAKMETSLNVVKENKTVSNATGLAAAKKKAVITKKPVDRNLIAVNEPQSYEAEQFRILKSKILFPVEGIPPRSILVTSALPGEGKSFVSTNVAISIAQNINEYVLLMDCDVRRPTIHTLFGYPDEIPGLTDYLAEDASLSSLLLNTEINKLTLLPAGTTPENPSELLSSAKMSDLVDEVIERYHDRYVIIDTPPLNLTSETSVIARLAEKVIIVVDFKHTKRNMVIDLIHAIGKEKVLGIVLNRYENMNVSNGYQKYSQYYKYSKQ